MHFFCDLSAGAWLVGMSAFYILHFAYCILHTFFFSFVYGLSVAWVLRHGCLNFSA